MKKSRLLEIIREEISAALTENDALQDKAKVAKMAYIKAAQAALDAEKKETTTGGALEEDQLNEMAFTLKKGLAPSEKLEPRYKKENFKKVVDLILSKVDGKKTMADVARELGVIQQKIRPVVSDLLDAGILEKGEAESKAGKDTANKPGPKAKAKEETPSKAKAEPKAKTEPKTPNSDEAPAGDAEMEKAARGRDELTKQYRGVMDTYKKMKAEEGDKAALEYLKTKQNIVKAYKKAQEVNI
jgi:hypothetical protein